MAGWQDAVRLGCLAVMAASLLFFVDAPLRTFGQRWVARRGRERNLLLALEVGMVLAWALLKYHLKWDLRLLPRAADPVGTVAGAALIVAGAGLAAWAKVRLGRWFSAAFGVKEGHVLVTDGPYAVTRHPIYTGMLVVAFGAALVWGSVLTLALASLLVFTLSAHARHEEALFTRHFGDAYRAYRRRVPRMLPLGRRGREG